MTGRSHQYLIPSFVEISQSVPEKKILKGFYHICIREWWPPWSCDPDAANKLSFPLPIEAIEAQHKIWQAVWAKKMFEIVDGQLTDT